MPDFEYTEAGEPLAPIERDPAEEVDPFSVESAKAERYDPGVTNVAAELKRSERAADQEYAAGQASDKIAATTDADVDKAVGKLAAKGIMPELDQVPEEFWATIHTGPHSGNLEADLRTYWQKWENDQAHVQMQAAESQKYVNERITTLVGDGYLDEAASAEAAAELMEKGGLEMVSPYLDAWVEIDPQGAQAFIDRLAGELNTAQLVEEQAAIDKQSKMVEFNAKSATAILEATSPEYRPVIMKALEGGWDAYILNSDNAAVAEERANELISRIAQTARAIEVADIKSSILAPSTDIGSGWEDEYGNPLGRAQIDALAVYHEPDFSIPPPPTKAQRYARETRAFQRHLRDADEIGKEYDKVISHVTRTNAKAKK